MCACSASGADNDAARVACCVVAIVQDLRRPVRNDALMNTHSPIRTIACGHAARQPWRRAAAWLRLCWQQLRLDEQTRYLGQAVDHADFERRMRALERCAGRPPC